MTGRPNAIFADEVGQLVRATRELIGAAELALPLLAGDRTGLAGRIALAHQAVARVAATLSTEETTR